MEGNTLVFEHQPQLIFPAGNEYRRMETVQMQYPGMRIDHIDYFAPYYHHFVELDKPRHSSLYTYDSTQHGRFFVREYNADDSDTEAPRTVTRAVASTAPAFILAPQAAPRRIDVPVDARVIAPTVCRLLRIRSPNGSALPPLRL